jgi:hypothetical protein
VLVTRFRPVTKYVFGKWINGDGYQIGYKWSTNSAPSQGDSTTIAGR